LTYSPSGAPVAAPTTSLPEDPGGVRNWDYRYVWPRDASIGIAAFLGVGKVGEARGFLAWLLHASRLQRPRLPALLTLDGRHVPGDRDLPGWVGYAGSVPVRVGNGAADQHQLDGYGWVVDAAWVLVQAGHPLDSETWRAVRGFADLVARRWREPDAGVWEIRGEAVHHVHSKLMGWLTLDRALCIADTHRLSARRRRRWQHARDAIATEVRARGFDSAKATYVRSYDSTELDAALLVLPLVGIDDLESPRVRGTIGDRGLAPGRGGGPRGVERGVDVLGGAAGHLREGLAVDRGDVLEVLALDRGHPLSADPVLVAGLEGDLRALGARLRVDGGEGLGFNAHGDLLLVRDGACGTGADRLARTIV
jgi:GH15 family glucan-1,4-alpha-glucosidase